MTSTTSLRHRRFKMMLVFAFVTAALLGWAAVELKWIRDRHEALQSIWSMDRAGELTAAPWPIRLLGEKGVAAISEHSIAPSGYSKGQIESLFPEATIDTDN